MDSGFYEPLPRPWAHVSRFAPTGLAAGDMRYVFSEPSVLSKTEGRGSVLISDNLLQIEFYVDSQVNVNDRVRAQRPEYGDSMLGRTWPSLTALDSTGLFALALELSEASLALLSPRTIGTIQLLHSRSGHRNTFIASVIQ